MNKEKWKTFMTRLSTGIRKFSVRSLMVVIAVFAMIGVASMVDFSNTTVTGYLLNKREEKNQISIRNQLSQAIHDKEPYLAATVLRYAYAKIDDLGTQTMGYTVQDTYEDYRGIGTFTIPGTKKVIEVECPGEVTAYYDPTDVSWKADSEKKVIYVTLPARVYVENELFEEYMTRVDTDNFLNKIKDSDIKKCVEALKAKGLEQVEANGLYDLVADSAKETIASAFAVLENYGVSFETSTVLKQDRSDEYQIPKQDVVEADPEEETEETEGDEWLPDGAADDDTDRSIEGDPGYTEGWDQNPGNGDFGYGDSGYGNPETENPGYGEPSGDGNFGLDDLLDYGNRLEGTDKGNPYGWPDKYQWYDWTIGSLKDWGKGYFEQR